MDYKWLWSIALWTNFRHRFCSSLTGYITYILKQQKLIVSFLLFSYSQVSSQDQIFIFTQISVQKNTECKEEIMNDKIAQEYYYSSVLFCLYACLNVTSIQPKKQRRKRTKFTLLKVSSSSGFILFSLFLLLTFNLMHHRCERSCQTVSFETINIIKKEKNI